MCDRNVAQFGAGISQHALGNTPTRPVIHEHFVRRRRREELLSAAHEEVGEPGEEGHGGDGDQVVAGLGLGLGLCWKRLRLLSDGRRGRDAHFLWLEPIFMPGDRDSCFAVGMHA